MTEPKWTHGPWSTSSGSAADPEGHVWKDGRLIASCMGHHDGTQKTYDENVANAQFIKASPDLYSALADLTNAARSYGWTDFPDFRGDLIGNARAALAKARGES